MFFYDSKGNRVSEMHFLYFFLTKIYLLFIFIILKIPPELRYTYTYTDLSLFRNKANPKTNKQKTSISVSLDNYSNFSLCLIFPFVPFFWIIYYIYIPILCVHHGMQCTHFLLSDFDFAFLFFLSSCVCTWPQNKMTQL